MKAGKGESRAAMTCARCGIMSTLLFDPEPDGYAERLADPFEWQCRFCGHKQFYAKSALKVMTPAQLAKPAKLA
jgi:ribosomal protein L37E